METLFGEDEVDGLVETLQKTPGWPACPDKDRALIATLRRQYPAMNLAEEILGWQRWLAVHGTGEETRSRGRWQRFGNWCAKARPRSGAPGLGGRRTGTYARPAAEFGDTRVGW